MSDEHFTVDGTLIEAWASQKSFRRKDGKSNPPGARGDVDFHGEKRKKETHELTTDPDARLFRKSRSSEAKAELADPSRCRICQMLERFTRSRFSRKAFAINDEPRVTGELLVGLPKLRFAR